MFGDKAYGDIADDLDDVIDSITVDTDGDPDDVLLDNQQAMFGKSIANPLVVAAKQRCGDEFRALHQKRAERRIKVDVGIRLNREVGNFTIEKNRIEKDRASQLDLAQTQEEEDESNRTHDEKVEGAPEPRRASRTPATSW